MAGMPTNRIARLRDAAGMVQSELARRLGVDVSTISRYERGEIKIPDERKLQMGTLFGVSVSHLMGWDDENGNGDAHHRKVA